VEMSLCSATKEHLLIEKEQPMGSPSDFDEILVLRWPAKNATLTISYIGLKSSKYQ